MKRLLHYSFFITFCGVLFATSSAYAQFLAHETRMRVGRHIDVDFIPAATHDTAFANASTALQVDNGSHDHACSLTLTRLDSWWFGGGDDKVDDQAEYEAVQNNASDAYVNIVNEVNWCLVDGAFGGCGWPQGARKPFLVTRNLATSPQAGIVYAHEFGHTVGLGHDDKGRQIMDPDVLRTNDNKVRRWADCKTFRTVFNGTCKIGNAGSDPAICTPIVVLNTGASSAATLASEGSTATPEPFEGFEEKDYRGVPIEKLASSHFVDRIPAEVEDYYGQQDVAKLRDMLYDPAYDKYRRTILSLIGLISNGASEDVQALTSYTMQEGGNISAAMMALGYIANRTGNKRALRFLLKSYKKKGGRMAEAAALGLSLSGIGDAHEALSRGKRAERDSKRKHRLGRIASQNRYIAKVGLREYYRNPQKMKRRALSVQTQEGDSGRE